VVLAAVVWAALGFYTIDEAERGGVMRFGELRDEVVLPGLRWNPPLIDEVQKVNISRVNTRAYSNDMLTTDENIVTVSISVQYVIADPMRYVVQVRDPQRGLDQAVESAVRHVVGGTTMDRVLTQGRADVAADVRARAQSYMEVYNTGIMITQVNVENAQPPMAVQASFDDVIRAREDDTVLDRGLELPAAGISEARLQRHVQALRRHTEVPLSPSTTLRHLDDNLPGQGVDKT
jgi:membrane protease subunit HflK